jgi:hypothetical protein
VPGLDVTRGYVDFFEPDVLVEAFEGMAAQIGWSNDNVGFDIPRVVTLETFYEISQRGSVEFAAGIDIVNVMQWLYDHEYRYQRRHKTLYSAINPVGDDAFFDVVLGAYPETEELGYIRQAYHDIFEPEVLASTPSTSLKIMNEGYACPLWLTRFSLEESFGRGRSDGTVFVFDAEVPQDVIEYWNYRLFHRRIIPINLQWFGEHASFICDLIVKTHRPIPGNPYGTMFHTNVCFASTIKNETMVTLAQEHLAKLPFHSFFLSRVPSIWSATKSSDRHRATKIIVKAKSVPFDEEAGSDGYVKAPAPAPEFEGTARLYTRACWINVICPSSSFQSGDQPAIVYPTNLWKPEYPDPAFGSRLTVSREGWVVAQHYSTGYSLLRPVGGRDALIGWFKSNGVDAYPSEEGQIAGQIILAAGGLGSCDMFADSETLSLLNGMAENYAERSRQGRVVLTTNPDRAKHVDVVRQHFDQREKRSFGYWNKLSYFLECSVFRAGLRVQCPTCAYYNWFDLDALSYVLTCNRCLTQIMREA